MRTPIEDPTRPATLARPRWLALALASSLLVAAAGCGSAKDTSSDTTRKAAVATKGEVEGCAGGWTDPKDLAAGRKPARCDAGAPAPAPLAEKKKLVVTSSTWNAEFTSAIVLGQAKGEFAKENLDVELKVVPPADQIQLLGSGKTDAAYTAPDAAFVNGVHNGFDLRWVAGNFSAPPSSKTGLWAPAKDGKPDVAALKGKKIVSAVGAGSVASYPIELRLAEAGLKLSDVTFQQLPAADVLTSLQNGAAPGGWVLDPYWTELEGDQDLAFAGGQPAGEPLGGLMFGPNLLQDDTAAGTAFLRAYIRTINTYFDGDYKADDALVDELAKALDVDPAILRKTPSQVWDWEIRQGTTERLQKAYIDGDALKVDEPLAEDELVDRSFADAAVGRKG